MSYSCTNNISKIIYNHDKNLIDNLQIGNLWTNYFEIIEIKKIVPWEEWVIWKKWSTIFPMENNKEEKIYFGISAGNFETEILQS